MGRASGTCCLLIGEGWMFCWALLPLIHLLRTSLAPSDLLPLVSPAGTGCHPLVSSLLGDHLGYWREELVAWCLSFNSRRIWAMRCSLCCMRDIHCVFSFLLLSVGWNVVQAVTYCSPSRKDHCFSLSLLIIFIHMNKKSWLKSCWAGLISSSQ